MTGFDSKQRMAADKLQEYDQTALELCNVCGWKTLIPDDGCLNCERAQPEQEPVDIAALVEGMEVSIDVSTGDHDSGNRLFGTVTLAQENQGSKHGLILLVQDPEPNFKPAPLPVQPVQEPVARVTGVYGGRFTYDPINRAMVLPIGMALYFLPQENT